MFWIAGLGWQNLSNCLYESSLSRGAVPSACDLTDASACGAASGRGACTPISKLCELSWEGGGGGGGGDDEDACGGCFWLALELHVDPAGAMCRCAGNFDGAACAQCGAGWRGARCSEPVAPLVRSNARAWSAADAARFGRGFEASLLADSVSAFQHASQVSGDNLGRTASMGECLDVPADPHRTPLEGGSLYALHWHRPIISWVEQGLARDGLLPDGVGIPMWDVGDPAQADLDILSVHPEMDTPCYVPFSARDEVAGKTFPLTRAALAAYPDYLSFLQSYYYDLHKAAHCHMAANLYIAGPCVVNRTELVAAGTLPPSCEGFVPAVAFADIGTTSPLFYMLHAWFDQVHEAWMAVHGGAGACSDATRAEFGSADAAVDPPASSCMNRILTHRFDLPYLSTCQPSPDYYGYTYAQRTIMELEADAIRSATPGGWDAWRGWHVHTFLLAALASGASVAAVARARRLRERHRHRGAGEKLVRELSGNYDLELNEAARRAEQAAHG